MYKVLNIGGEEYKLEFSIEASLYNDCIEKVTSLMFEIDDSQSRRDVKKMLSGISDVPNTAVTCFYAGLLEHHGVDGDGKVMNRSVAKRLVAQLLKDENSGLNNFYDIFTMCLDQMAEDGFFDLIGLSDMLKTETRKKEPKKPQDHKKKSTKSAKDTEEQS